MGDVTVFDMGAVQWLVRLMRLGANLVMGDVTLFDMGAV